MADKCIVYGCHNHKGEGTFIGDICGPCYSHITTGVIGPTTSFLGYADKKIKHLEKLIKRYETDYDID